MGHVVIFHCRRSPHDFTTDFVIHGAHLDVVHHFGNEGALQKTTTQCYSKKNAVSTKWCLRLKPWETQMETMGKIVAFHGIYS